MLRVIQAAAVVVALSGFAACGGQPLTERTITASISGHVSVPNPVVLRVVDGNLEVHLTAHTTTPGAYGDIPELHARVADRSDGAAVNCQPGLNLRWGSENDDPSPSQPGLSDHWVLYCSGNIPLGSVTSVRIVHSGGDDPDNPYPQLGR